MDTISPVSGKFLLPGEARSFNASLLLWQEGRVEVRVGGNEELNRNCAAEEYNFGPVVPGLAVDVLFNDGAVFTPDDSAHRWQDPRVKGQNFLSFLERNLYVVLFVTLLTPLVFWWIINDAIPRAVDVAVLTVPQGVPDRMGKDSLLLLDKIYLDESTLGAADKQAVEALWLGALQELELDPSRYQLLFRASDSIGANAFALPNGTVIVTDELVELLDEKPQAMLSILLHEIGHVEHRHSLKLVGRSLSTSIVFAVFLGDIEGMGELLLGAGSSLLSSAFSREMETEADEYSFDKLEQLGISPAVFADAMEALQSLSFEVKDESQFQPGEEFGGADSEPQDAPPEVEEGFSGPGKYLNSHPATKERIKAARKRGEAFSKK